MRLRASVDMRYANAYIFGVFFYERGAAVGLLVPYVNGEMMQLHVDEVSDSSFCKMFTLPCSPMARDGAQRIFSSYNDIVDACQIAWNKMTAEKGRITSLPTFRIYNVRIFSFLGITPPCVTER